MHRSRIIIVLEDDADRIHWFHSAVAALGKSFRIRLWHDAPTMIAECASCLAETSLISLDYDLHLRPTGCSSPGTGIEVAKFLAKRSPVCPVIIHTGSTDAAWNMYRLFQAKKWTAEMVPPLGHHWVRRCWLPRARALLM